MRLGRVGPELAPPALINLFQLPEYSCHSRKKRNGSEFSELRGTLPITVFPRSDDGHKRDVRIARRQRVVNVVPKIKRRRGIALPENFLQSFRMRLPLRVVHRNDRAKVPYGWPILERKREFLPRPPCEEVQLVSPSPLFYLPRRHHQLFVSNVSRLPVAPPIEFFERRARLFVRSGMPH